MNKDQKTKCSKVRKCKWKGVFGDLVDKKVDDSEFDEYEKVCPKCGHNEFYDIDN